ncbi:hypothetical protein A2U01_0027466 [Trifolium medium]|uniref:Uncharacterized protein n=1 Tax=Trifolium medium TaxID=97028 RepID=A0A392P354_9FABA|nr:hypothetical protein [Trifolium medium]
MAAMDMPIAAAVSDKLEWSIKATDVAEAGNGFYHDCCFYPSHDHCLEMNIRNTERSFDASRRCDGELGVCKEEAFTRVSAKNKLSRVSVMRKQNRSENRTRADRKQRRSKTRSETEQNERGRCGGGGCVGSMKKKATRF